MSEQAPASLSNLDSKQLLEAVSKIVPSCQSEETVLNVCKRIASLYNPALGYAFPSKKHIATKTNTSTSEVADSVRLLEIAGILSISKSRKNTRVDYERVRKVGSRTVISKATKNNYRCITQYRFNLERIRAYAGKSLMADIEVVE